MIYAWYASASSTLSVSYKLKLLKIVLHFRVGRGEGKLSLTWKKRVKGESKISFYNDLKRAKTNRHSNS